ncbi:hypothetical protein SAMN05216462_3095 [Xylanibacter ruminicola]|uniref:DUF3300 domain-containing protein n=1 Tax=Xylanibacter ruminicola TaxID=839 RepID=A0A1H4F335_XYLRU|nr:hypothetical protein [Xylanibacter ruminicola]SEA91724.1 hypothetical protein SAMN05216462_3095 [Xylanibacter ruminicola]
MKKMFFALMVMLTSTMAASAMSYEQARNEALFLTDKMAYELNLTDEQYEAAYEINLDYLMGVAGRDDVFGTYWERRNLDLSYILYDWQWNAYIAASYFYRPLYWEAGYWHFGIYRRYPHRDFFYFGRPHFYATYRGGHAWHIHGTHGYYYGRREHFRPTHRQHFGMHDRWNRGDFRNPRHSSTRVTGRHDSHRIDGRHDSYRHNDSQRRYDNRNIERRNNTNRNDDVYRHSDSHRNNSSFSGYRGGSNSSSMHSSSSHGTRSIGGSTHSNSSHSSGANHSEGSRMGGRR